MASPVCPQCEQPIPAADVNVGADVVFCRCCNRAAKLSDLVKDAGDPISVDLTTPPRGCWRRDDGVAIRIGASHRSVGGVIGTLFIFGFWNGIVSVFVLICIASWWQLLAGPPPHWFPAPVMNGSSMGWGMTIFMTLFLTPFVLIGTVLALAVLMTLAGRTEVTLRGPDGEVFTGIGAIGRRRRFDVAQVDNVALRTERSRDSDGDVRTSTSIFIERRDEEAIKFGAYLPKKRRMFLAGSVREIVGV